MRAANEVVLLVLAWMRGQGPDRFVMHERITADTGFDAKPTAEEMRRLMHAAKMEWGRCLRRRLRTKGTEKERP